MNSSLIILAIDTNEKSPLKKCICQKNCQYICENNIFYMGVSKNSGIPKSSILIGFSIINHPFWGFSPYFWKHPHHIITHPWMCEFLQPRMLLDVVPIRQLGIALPCRSAMQHQGTHTPALPIGFSHGTCSNGAPGGNPQPNSFSMTQCRKG